MDAMDAILRLGRCADIQTHRFEICSCNVSSRPAGSLGRERQPQQYVVVRSPEVRHFADIYRQALQRMFAGTGLSLWHDRLTYERTRKASQDRRDNR